MSAAPSIYQQFRLSAFVCMLLAVGAGALLLIYGKTGSFLLINGLHTPSLDRAMPFLTYLGDGLIYIPILLVTFFFRRDYIVAIISGIVICTIITHFFKRVVFPGELRPFSLEAQNILFHKIDGVKLHSIHSFPSGHTSTAFTMALLLAGLMKQRVWVIGLPFAALLVGFSRIYLAQHFLTDVTGGILIGILSAYLSLLIYKAWHARRLRKKAMALH